MLRDVSFKCEAEKLVKRHSMEGQCANTRLSTVVPAMEHEAGESEVTRAPQQDPVSKISKLSARKIVEVERTP